MQGLLANDVRVNFKREIGAGGLQIRLGNLLPIQAQPRQVTFGNFQPDLMSLDPSRQPTMEVSNDIENDEEQGK